MSDTSPPALSGCCTASLPILLGSHRRRRPRDRRCGTPAPSRQPGMAPRLERCTSRSRQRGRRNGRQAGQRLPGDVLPAEPRAGDDPTRGFHFTHTTTADRLMGFPARLRLGARLPEMNLHLDMVDPCERNEMVLTAVDIVHHQNVLSWRARVAIIMALPLSLVCNRNRTSGSPT